MSRNLFSIGCRGDLIEEIQRAIWAMGIAVGIDGVYGPGTAAALRLAQSRQGIPPTGRINDVTWETLCQRPAPTVLERVLQLTGQFEGHGYCKAVGDFDGAWLTWGIIGFTLRYGALTSVLLAIADTDFRLLESAFGKDNALALATRLRRNNAEDLQTWAQGIRGDRQGLSLIEPWQSGFAKLGRDPRVQAIQRAAAARLYFAPALQTAQRFALTTEQGIALAFDIHVQNGGVKRASSRMLLDAFAKEETTQSHRRERIAHEVSQTARPQYAADVLSRKLTLATGTGVVHGLHISTAAWGIGEFEADINSDAQDPIASTSLPGDRHREL